VTEWPSEPPVSGDPSTTPRHFPPDAKRLHFPPSNAWKARTVLIAGALAGTAAVAAVLLALLGVYFFDYGSLEPESEGGALWIFLLLIIATVVVLPAAFAVTMFWLTNSANEINWWGRPAAACVGLMTSGAAAALSTLGLLQDHISNAIATPVAAAMAVSVLGLIVATAVRPARWHLAAVAFVAAYAIVASGLVLGGFVA
jgi:hypothetical protein